MARNKGGSTNQRQPNEEVSRTRRANANKEQRTAKKNREKPHIKSIMMTSSVSLITCAGREMREGRRQAGKRGRAPEEERVQM